MAQRAILPAANLLAVAEVSTQIRQIYTWSFAMQLHATNAMVLTRSRGVRVPGFEAVAAQMGALSRELACCIARLRSVTVGWAAVMSAQVAIARQRSAMASAAAANERTAALVAGVLARQGDGSELRRTYRALGSILDDVRQLAATGCVLARTAKLEAVYGGTLAEALSQAALEFTGVADAIDNAVRAIARRVKH